MKPSFISLKEHRFGRNSLWAVGFIHLVCVCLLFAGHPVATISAGVVTAATWIASWINWKAFLKIDHSHPNNHYPDIAEGSDPPTMKDGRPILVMDWWYAATRGTTREEAHAHLQRLRMAGGFILLRHEYDEYLRHPKFKNYPK